MYRVTLLAEAQSTLRKTMISLRTLRLCEKNIEHVTYFGK